MRNPIAGEALRALAVNAETATEALFPLTPLYPRPTAPRELLHPRIVIPFSKPAEVLRVCESTCTGLGRIQLRPHSEMEAV